MRNGFLRTESIPTNWPESSGLVSSGTIGIRSMNADVVKTVAHVDFEADDLEQTMHGQEVLIPPNSPSAGVIVAFITVAGAPVELSR
jgi:hypothetical protein